MDKTAEKLSHWFGSSPFIAFHVVWFALWFPFGGATELLTLVVSLEAIFLALFILRAQNVSERRQTRDVKQDLRESKKILKEIENIYEILKYRH